VRVGVTGAAGRLGRALVAALEEAPFAGPFGPIAWDRRRFDLDDPAGIGALLDADRVEVVVHAAAWTNVDACARDPDLAMRRNGWATGIVATACAARGIDLIVVSTNEVFDGRRSDGRGYGPADVPRPANAYGVSKLAGERAAAEAFGWAVVPGMSEADAAPADRPSLAGGRLGIVRTAWLFGPPGNDFPAKILAAAERARADGQPLRVVGDEIGSPTFAPDLAEAIGELIGSGDSSGIHHVVNAGAVSRADWASELLRGAGVAVSVEPIPGTAWQRASQPPSWAVLEATPLPSGEPLRPWQEALADYLPALLRSRIVGTRR
jgi:dTDP-4-dehydrorhamnose reductase